jgi:hypothetical protein
MLAAVMTHFGCYRRHAADQAAINSGNCMLRTSAVRHALDCVYRRFGRPLEVPLEMPCYRSRLPGSSRKACAVVGAQGKDDGFANIARPA